MERCPVLWSLSEEHDRFLRAAHGLWLPPWGRSSLDASIARYLKVWRAHILAHCRLEEEILLPELTPAISEADALVVFTTGDHLILRRLARDLAGCSPEGCQPLACRLAQKLDAHIRFEERTLFPALEATLGRTRLRE
ncbi:MAG TPA: hemerythrin domain-containing protein, partial [Anaeromyxobacteraceae bacterium]|nr:hemerythrin domain-containing protein [Anaeromyxobacteraceae bacterium]